MKEPHFNLQTSGIPVHSEYGCLYIASQIAADNHERHIPARKHFPWESVQALQGDKTGCAQSMGEAVFKIMNHFASKIQMDPLYLANNARTIMEYNNWNLEPLDPSKRTPFNVALDLFEAVVEADKIKRANDEDNARREANLARAAICRKQHMEYLAELATRVPEERTCLACNANIFTYHYPKGQGKGWVNDALPPNELDPDWHCKTCKEMICLSCKGAICSELEEMQSMICNDCQKNNCQLCSQIIMTKHTLQHNVCLACFKNKTCTTCKQFNANCVEFSGLIQCTECTTKCIICKANLQAGELQICQDCRQFDYES
jgi:hypothetical protein